MKAFKYGYMVRPFRGARWKVISRTLDITPRQFREIMNEIIRDRAQVGASFILLNADEV